MALVSTDDLRRVLREVTGESPDDVDEASFLETSLEQLGYDSLALMEAAARIQQEFGVRLADDDVFRIGTPRELLRFVNDAAATGR